MLELLKLAIPISLANIIGVIAVIINTKIVGDVSSYNLYLLTLFMPLNFWVISLFESFRVPAISVTTYAYSRGELNLIGSQIGCLLFITLMGIIIPFVSLIISPNLASTLLSISNAHDSHQFTLFVAYMLPASFLLSAFFIVISTFNGIGRHQFAAVITVIGVIFCIVLNYYLINNTQLQILSLPISSISTYLVLLIYLCFIHFRAGIFSVTYFKKSFSIANFKIIKKLALPVWVTYLFVTFGIAFFNNLLSSFGRDSVAGFGIAYRIQSILLLPAISLGVAAGILLNKNKNIKNSKPIIEKGMLICLVSYAVISLSIYYKNNYLMSLITSDSHLIENGHNYFKIVSLSYIGISVFICYCIILDQVGSGFKSTLFSGAIFFIEVIIAIALTRYWHKPEAVYWAIAIGNCISGLVVLWLFLFENTNQFTPSFITITNKEVQ